jgi:AcrR family transcriptional regulator
MQVVARDEARDRIVQAAIDVFLEKGYGGARVQDIARRAGYTAGALYVHFPNRATLLGEAITVEGGRLIAEIIERFGAITPGEGMVATALVEFTLAETGSIDRLMLEALALASRDADAREMLASTLANFESQLVQKISYAQRTGVVDPALDVDSICTFFSAWILGQLVHRAVGLGRADATALHEVYQRAVRGFTPAARPPG